MDHLSSRSEHRIVGPSTHRRLGGGRWGSGDTYVGCDRDHQPCDLGHVRLGSLSFDFIKIMSIWAKGDDGRIPRIRSFAFSKCAFIRIVGEAATPTDVTFNMIVATKNDKSLIRS